MDLLGVVGVEGEDFTFTGTCYTLVTSIFLLQLSKGPLVIGMHNCHDKSSNRPSMLATLRVFYSYWRISMHIYLDSYYYTSPWV